MSAVFESKTLPATARLVMLALADHADDEGRCYPSIRRLCERTGLTERSVQNSVKYLCENGYLTVSMNAGPKGVNLYTVTATPAGNAPPQEMHLYPRISCGNPRSRCAQTVKNHH